MYDKFMVQTYDNKKNENVMIVKVSIEWTTSATPKDLRPEWYCATRDVFQARLQTLLSRLEKQVGDDSYLLTAITGEIGNNSFDHNLGNWRDIPGVFFADDESKKIIVLADRGQGVFNTLSRVTKDVKNDTEALITAFTKTISGRYPERRGNGLKFVASTVKGKKWKLSFYSGDALMIIKSGLPMQTNLSAMKVNGCCAILWY